MKKYLLNLLIGSLLCLLACPANANIIYVDSSNVLGLHNGSSWATAYNYFQDGINNATAGDSIWVARGSYTPITTAPFSMKEGVKIFGGFLNTYTQFNQRNIAINKTILKGNNYNIMRNMDNGLTNAARIDGFVFTKGYSSNFSGGAMYNYNVSPAIINCLFYDNVVYGSSTYKGGAVYNNGGAPRFVNCTFNYNRSNEDGGGAIYNYSSSMKAINCLFIKNYAVYGGAVYNLNSNDTFVNCTMSQNRADNNSSGVFYNIMSGNVIYNSIIWGNQSGAYGSGGDTYYSLIQYLAAGNATYHMIDGGTNPLFVDTAAGNFQLQSNSPCRNVGYNGYVENDILTDLNLNPRIKENVVDMGAIEVYGTPEPHLGNDTAICANTPLTIEALCPGSTYLWSTGVNTPSINVDTSGTYSVTVTNLYGTATDSVTIVVHSNPVVHLGNDTTVINSMTLVLDAHNQGAAYLWNTGAQTQMITVNTNGLYGVLVTDNNQCSGSDSIHVTFTSTGIADLQYLEKQIEVFPIPASSVLQIVNHSGMPIEHIRLQDVLGKTVYSSSTSLMKQTVLDLHNLQSGAYVLHLYCSGITIIKKIQIIR